MQFLVKNKTSMLQHLLFSSDFDSYGFWFFLQLKNPLKEKHVDSVEAVQTKLRDVPKQLL